MAAKPRRPMVLVSACVAIVAAMTGLTLSAAPLYAAFCRVTGYGGTTQVSARAPSQVLARTIEVRFDANVSPDTPLEFKPDQLSQTLHIGESGLAYFTVKNVSAQPVKAIASYNVTPHLTGVYFHKLQCFCFKDRVFQPGETARLPVIFFVDPGLVADRETRATSTITLSYTYFRKDA